jgi:hypothetical protein
MLLPLLSSLLLFLFEKPLLLLAWPQGQAAISARGCCSTSINAVATRILCHCACCSCRASCFRCLAATAACTTAAAAAILLLLLLLHGSGANTVKVSQRQQARKKAHQVIHLTAQPATAILLCHIPQAGAPRRRGAHQQPAAVGTQAGRQAARQPWAGRQDMHSDK